MKKIGEDICGIDVLPCPFCGWEKIRIILDKQKKGLLKGSEYTYCWCKVCGTRGPWAYSISEKINNFKDCIKRWNERSIINEKTTQRNTEATKDS